MKILLIEDDREQLVLMQEFLRGSGFDVDGVTSIIAAIEHLRAHAPDLIVSDFLLGDGSAAEMLDQIDWPHDRIVIVSAQRETGLPDDVTVLQKPVDCDDFVREIVQRTDRQPSAPTMRSSEASVRLRLYTAGHSRSSAAARRNLQRVIDESAPGRIELSEIDVLEDPALVDADDRIIFTPTLVRLRPEPRTWIIGELSDDHLLRDLILVSGNSES